MGGAGLGDCTVKDCQDPSTASGNSWSPGAAQEKHVRRPSSTDSMKGDRLITAEGKHPQVSCQALHRRQRAVRDLVAGWTSRCSQLVTRQRPAWVVPFQL